MANQMYSIRKRALVDISENTQNSEIVDLEGLTIVGLEVPSNFDGTSITVKGSALDKASVQNIYDTDGNQMVITTAASRYVAINPAALHGVRYLQLVCGSAQTTNDTELYVVLREIR